MNATHIKDPKEGISTTALIRGTQSARPLPHRNRHRASAISTSRMGPDTASQVAVLQSIAASPRGPSNGHHHDGRSREQPLLLRCSRRRALPRRSRLLRSHLRPPAPQAEWGEVPGYDPTGELWRWKLAYDPAWHSPLILSVLPSVFGPTRIQPLSAQFPASLVARMPGPENGRRGPKVAVELEEPSRLLSAHLAAAPIRCGEPA